MVTSSSQRGLLPLGNKHPKKADGTQVRSSGTRNLKYDNRLVGSASKVANQAIGDLSVPYTNLIPHNN